MPAQEADYDIEIDWNEADNVPTPTPPPAYRSPAARATPTPTPVDDYDDDDDEEEESSAPASVPAPVTPPQAAATAAANGISNEDDRDLAVVHARAAKAEGAPMITEGAVIENHDTIELLGKKFRIAEKIGLMPLLKYASAADMSSDDPRALGAVYMMLRDCIYAGSKACGNCEHCKAGREAMCKSFDTGDWQAFENHAIETKADAEELLPVISQVMEIVSGRPTKPRDGSSVTPPTTQRVSTGNGSGTRKKASRR